MTSRKEEPRISREPECSTAICHPSLTRLATWLGDELANTCPTHTYMGVATSSETPPLESIHVEPKEHPIRTSVPTSRLTQPFPGHIYPHAAAHTRQGGEMDAWPQGATAVPEQLFLQQSVASSMMLPKREHVFAFCKGKTSATAREKKNKQ